MIAIQLEENITGNKSSDALHDTSAVLLSQIFPSECPF